jgi:hypothetical protein
MLMQTGTSEAKSDSKNEAGNPQPENYEEPWREKQRRDEINALNYA